MATTLKSGPPPARKKIFIVEDHPVFREGLAQLINSERDMTVCGGAGTAAQGLRAITRLKPDLVLVDITLPGTSGLELVKQLRARGCAAKLLVVSMHDEALYAERVLRAGGDGYVMKEEDPDEIIHAIRDVLGGHIYVSEAVVGRKPQAAGRGRAAGKLQSLAELTDLELEILESLGRGKTNPEIARQLRLSTRTVADSCGQMRRKLNLKNANELIRYAVCWVEIGAA